MAADGNMGSLWVSLGIKDAFTKGLKQLEAELKSSKKNTDDLQQSLNDIGKGLSEKAGLGESIASMRKFQELAAKSKTDLKGFADVFSKISDKDLSKLFGNKVNATNARGILNVLRSINTEIGNFKKHPGDILEGLYVDLNKYSGVLSKIATLTNDISNASYFSKHGMTSEFTDIAAKLKSVRSEMISLFNEGGIFKGKKYEELLKVRSGTLTEMAHVLEKLQDQVDPFRPISDGAKSATKELEKTASTAKKTAEDVKQAATKIKSATEGTKVAPVQTENADKATAKLKEAGTAARETSTAVQKAATSLNNILNQFQGKDARNLPLEEAAKRAGEYVYKLIDINNQLRKAEKSANSENGDKDAFKSMRAAVDNAIKYLGIIHDIGLEYKKIEGKKVENPNIDTKKIEEAKSALTNFYNEMLKLQDAKTGVDKAFVVGDFGKVFRMVKADLKDLMSVFDKENKLSVFVNNVAAVESKLAGVGDRLAQLKHLTQEGIGKGYDTSMLGERIKNLQDLEARLKSASKSPEFLTNTGQMKNLLSDIAVEFANTTKAMHDYGRAKSKVIAQEREQNKEDAKSERNRKRLADNTRNLKDLVSQLSHEMAMAEKHGAKGIQLNVDTKNLDKSLSDIREFIDILNSVKPGLLGNRKRGALDFSDYKQMADELKRALDEAVSLQKDLNRAQEKTNRKNEANARRDEANARRDEAKATREANAAEKQRQRELENSKNRVQSMEKALKNLQEKRFTSKSLGLDTSEADAKIKSMKKSLEDLRDLIDRLGRKDMKAVGLLGDTGNGREVREANELARQYDRANKEVQKGTDLEKKRQQEVENTARKIQSELVRGFQDANKHAGSLNNTLQDIKALFLQGGLVFGAQQFAMSIITTGGEMEKQHIALQSILGDMQNANTLFGQIKELALNSPFTFSELNRDVKQLAAYGVEYDQLYDTTKRLADMSSGLGVSFDRIALAFGQVQARGWLDGKELRQIAYAGIPLLNKLSEFYSKREGTKVSTSDVKKRISNREVGFDDVKQIFWEMTDAGGQFYNMQQTLSETLLGRYNKLKDAWEIMLADFASGDSAVGSFFKTAISGATTLVQSLHSLALPFTAVFGGIALRKALGGTSGSNFLENKGKVANDIQQKAIRGESLTAVERRVLATKKQITNEDLRNLQVSKQLTMSELSRLRISGKITSAQYKQFGGMKLMDASSLRLAARWRLIRMQIKSINLKDVLSNPWRNFSTAGVAAVRIVGVGLKGLGATLWSAIGGLPGLIISGITFGITYAYGKSQELKQQLEQTQKELADRMEQISKFKSDNNIAKALSSGDEKEIDNMIEAYKEKLKELAPYDFNNMVMKANEEKSHKKRLAYLEKELELLKEAENVSSLSLADKRIYGGLKDVIGNADTYLLSTQQMAYKSKTGKDFYGNSLYTNWMKSNIPAIKDEITKAFGDIGEAFRKQKKGLKVKPEDIIEADKIVKAANQAMSSIFSVLQVPEDRANIIRASVLQSFGIGDRDGWLQNEVSDRLSSLIESTSVVMAAKLKANIPLTKAEKEKVKELMEDAKNGLISKYPELAETLQNMLDSSHFKAVIDLVYNNTGGKFNDLQSLLVSRIPSFQSFQKVEKETYARLAESWGKENSTYEARNKARSDIDALKNEVVSQTAAQDPRLNMTKYKLQVTKQAAKDMLNYDYDGELKKNNKPPKDNTKKEDLELKRLRERIELYKKLYDEIKRTEDYYGKGGALGKLRNDGEFKSVFSNRKGYPITDYTDYGKSIRQILGTVPASTADRVAYRNEQIANIHSENRKIEEENIKTENDELGKQLDIISEEYEVYKKLYKLTGDRRGAASVAFGGKAIQSESKLEYLKGQVAKYLPEANKRSNSNLTVDNVMAMSDGDLDKTFGKDAKNISVAIDKLKTEQNKILEETIDSMSDIIEKNSTIEQQIEDENRQYEYQKKLIEDSDFSPEMKDRALKGLASSHDENSAKLKFEKFKKDNDWVSIFDDLDRVSMNTITDMKGKIETFSKTTPGLPVESVKSLREALSKLYTESINRNPMDAIINATSRGNAIGDILKNRAPGKDGKYTIVETDTKRTGLQKGTYTKSELENARQASYDDFGKGVSSLANKFKALQDCLSPVINLFDALGMEDTPVGEAASMTSNALGAASQTASGLQSLGLGNMGPYGAAAAAALSVASSIFALHDKALQREIEASERRQKEMENMTKNVKSVIESTLGGIYNYRASGDVRDTLNKVVADYNKVRLTTVRTFGVPVTIKNNSVYSKETYDAAQTALSKPDSAYHAQWASLLAQRDELQKQSDSESKKKKKDKDKIADYKQQLTEMEQQIKEFAQDFLKTIYSIDFKSWASELTDAVVSAWEAGEDAVDAYKKKVRSLLKDVTKNIVSQKIVEAYMQKPLDMLTETLKEKGKLDEDDIVKLANELYDGAKGASDSVVSVFEKMKELGYDLRDDGSSSTSNSIKGITEETADILASYVNAIRLDVSVNRANIKDIADATGELPNITNLSKAQLSAMNQLVTLAQYRNDALDDMKRWMNQVTNGTKKISVA